MKTMRQTSPHPKGAGLGPRTKDNPFGVVYFDDCMAVGGRAQKREMLRQAKRAAAKGDPEAAKAVRIMTGRKP